MSIYPDVMRDDNIVIPYNTTGRVPATIPFSETTSFGTIVSNYANGLGNRRQLLQYPYRRVDLNYSSINGEKYKTLLSFFNQQKGMARSFSFYYPPAVNTYYDDQFVGIVPSAATEWVVSLPSHNADVAATGDKAPKLRVGGVNYIYNTDYKVAAREMENEAPTGFGTVSLAADLTTATLTHRGDWEVLKFMSTIYVPTLGQFLQVQSKPTFPTVVTSGGTLQFTGYAFYIYGGYGIDEEDKAFFNQSLPAGFPVRWSFASRDDETFVTRLRIDAIFADDTLADVNRYGSWKAYDLNIQLNSVKPELLL